MTIKKPEDLLSVPGYRDFMDLLDSASALLEEELKMTFRRGGVLQLDPSYEYLAIVGDLHGDHVSLGYILDHIIRKDPSLENTLLVTLGDYIDRGRPDGQIAVLSALMRLKLARPDNVFMLRGNHEPPSGLEPIPHDYPMALASIYGARLGSEAYDASRSFFDLLPYVAIIKGYMLAVHGGPPTSSIDLDTEEYLSTEWPPPLEILEEVLWNDPSEHVEFREPSPRGAGWLWGAKVTEAALTRLGVRYIVRGHEPTPNGYKTNHNDKVITLFSRLGAPYFNLRASFIHCRITGAGGELDPPEPSSCIILFE